MNDILERVKADLIAHGFDGLVYPGECGCELSDLAPCGNCEKEDREDFINGCDGGYKYIDPQDNRFFCISTCKESPDESEWDNIRALY